MGTFMSDASCKHDVNTDVLLSSINRLLIWRSWNSKKRCDIVEILVTSSEFLEIIKMLSKYFDAGKLSIFRLWKATSFFLRNTLKFLETRQHFHKIEIQSHVTTKCRPTQFNFVAAAATFSTQFNMHFFYASFLFLSPSFQFLTKRKATAAAAASKSQKKSKKKKPAVPRIFSWTLMFLSRAGLCQFLHHVFFGATKTIQLLVVVVYRMLGLVARLVFTSPLCLLVTWIEHI